MAPSRVRGSGVSLINMAEMFRYERIGNPPMELAPILAGRRSDWLVEAGDLLFARQSLIQSGAGKCVLVLASEVERTFESHIIRVRLDRRCASPDYYFYYFNSPQGRENMTTIIEQVAAAGIRASDLARLEVPLPPLAIQSKVASALTAIDDLVDLLRLRIESISQMMRALLDQVSASDLNDLPIRSVFRPRKDKMTTRELSAAYVGLDHMDRGSLLVVHHGDLKDSQTANRIFSEGDILFGRIRPYFRNVGFATFPGAAAQSIEVLEPAKPEFKIAGYLELASQRVVDAISARATGTTMPQVTWASVEDIVLRIPSYRILANFNSQANPLLEGAVLASREVTQLVAAKHELMRQMFRSETQVRFAEAGV